MIGAGSAKPARPAMTTNTIFALATGAGRAGVAVIRVSGPDAGDALRRLTGRALPAPRLAARVRFSDPVSGQALDDGLCLWFPAPASFTGEDVAECHIHGGRASIAAMIDALGNLPGLRLAEPGEFSRRAFENDKLDLTAIEGLADLVDAETEAQRRQALRQLDGELGAVYERWRERLVQTLARLEAHLDFPEEGLPEHIVTEMNHDISRVISEISLHLEDNRRGERLRDGIHIAILGPPNAGKSSLFNRLAQRNAAIVSPAVGTTRDVIEVHLDIGGYPAIIADTAGLRQADGEIEREGVERALARAADADLKIVVLDASCGDGPDPTTLAVVDENTLIVRNKIDLAAAGAPSTIAGHAVAADISVKTGAGLSGLLARIEVEIVRRLEAAGPPPLTRARHRAALEECRLALLRAREGSAPELTAEDVRLAVRAIGRITGRVDVEDVLDVIFRDFCIGK